MVIERGHVLAKKLGSHGRPYRPYAATSEVCRGLATPLQLLTSHVQTIIVVGKTGCSAFIIRLLQVTVATKLSRLLHHLFYLSFSSVGYQTAQ